MASDPTYPCEQCGNPVGPTTNRSKNYQKRFCSIRCRNINNLRRLEKIPCPVCGKPFKPYARSDTGHKKYCSQKCAHAANGARVWSDEERRIVAERYPTEGADLLAAEFDTTISSIQCIAYREGVTLDDAVFAERVHGTAREYMTENNPMFDPEVRQKVADYWEEHPKERDRVLSALFEGHQKLEKDQPSGLEEGTAEMLDEFRVPYEHAHLIKPKFVVDFLIEDHLILQVDGDYWHGHPRFEPLTDRQLAQQRRDKAQDAYLETCGYTVVRIWESDLDMNTLRNALEQHGITCFPII